MQRKFAPLQLMLTVVFASLFSSGTFCRYSVRDVGFVNVHGHPWQLKIIRPDAVGDAELAQWQTSLESSLAGSNVTNEWVRPESVEGKRLVQLFKNSSDESAWMAAIYGPGDMVFRLDVSKVTGPDSFNEKMQSVLRSPRREKILDQITTALCVIVVVECGDSVQDKRVNMIATAAAAQIAGQMWMMEKPTKVGPVVETISANVRKQEKWMLKSLGLNPTSPDPQLAIVYGQGRRLGDVLVGPDILESTIAKVAALCGQSCECDLDRAWLYGTQMIHVWGDARASIAEDNLDFDPGAALVLAEVNGIVNGSKSGTKRSNSLIGNGLIIHDFSDLDDVVQNDAISEHRDEQEAEVEPERRTELAKPETTGVTSAFDNAIIKSPLENKPNNDPQRERPAAQQSWGSRWILLVIAGSIVLAVALFAAIRGRE